MPIKGGRGVNGKITYIQLDDFDDTTDLMEIQQTDRDILLILSEQLDWSNRWLEPPPPLDDPDTRDAYISGLKLRLMEMVNFCEKMIDCIANDSDVQNALNDLYNQFARGKALPTSERNRGLGGVNTECDPDILFGMVSELIEQMHINNTDFQEAMETLSNTIERLAQVIAAIPVFETLPVDDAFDFVQGVLTDDLFEAYLANDTTTYRDELKCDLFCLARDNNCVITFDMLVSVFTTRLGYVGLDDFNSLIIFLTSGAWVGTQINDLFFLLQLAAMKFGNQFFSIIGLKMFDFYAKLGADNPSSDWELLCEVCTGDYCKLWDMSEGLQGWIIVDSNGEELPEGIGSNGTIAILLYRSDFNNVKINSVRIRVTPNVAALQVEQNYPTQTDFVASNTLVGNDITIDTSAIAGYNAVDIMSVKGTIDGLTVVTGLITQIEVCYTGEYIEF